MKAEPRSVAVERWIGIVALSLLGAGDAPRTDEGSSVLGNAPLMVADFDREGWRTNLGQPFGTWDRDPGDRTQFCRARLVDEPRLGDRGYSLMLEYDVASPNPAYNGFWLQLPNMPLRRYAALSLAVKGDSDRSCTRRVKLELKDRTHTADYVLDGIQERWVRMHVPLTAFRNIEKVRAATEFVIVFDDQTVTQPTGALYLDEIMFEPAS